jgi:hypothetical protein
MRGGRSLLVLLVFALGLGAYIYFVESKRDPTASAAKEKLFAVEASAIEEIEIKTADGTTTLKKTGESWAITSPVAAAADAGMVSSVTGALSTLEIDQIVDENPASVAQFGLDAPTVTVGFKAAGDSAMRRLNLGRKVPTEPSVYARVDGQARLILIPSFQEDTFKKTPFDLRDKRALVIERERVDAVTLAARGNATVTLAGKDGTWRLSAPLDARADFTPVDSIIGRLSGAQMTSVVAEGSELTPAQLRTYGLDAPQVTATLGAGSTLATLAIGGKKDDTTLYARDLSRPIVFTVETALLTDLTKTPDDLRVKTVFEFQPYTALGLDATYGGTSASFGKKKPAGTDANVAEVWAQVKPTAKDVNQTAMTDLLNTLASLRADKFVASAPSGGTEILLAARAGDAAAPVEERVTLRKVGTTAYVVRPGDPGAAVIPTADFDRTVTQLQALTSAK